MVWSFHPPYQVFDCTSSWDNNLLDRVYRQKHRRGHFTVAGIVDVRSIFGYKDGVEESATGVNCAARICEFRSKHDTDALFRTPWEGLLPFRFYLKQQHCEMAAQQRNPKAMMKMRASENKWFAVFKYAQDEYVVENTHSSERKILDRVLKTKKFCNRGRPRRGVIIRAGVVNLCKFRMLTRGYCVGSSSCGLEPCVTDFRIAPAFAAASFCAITVVHLQVDPNFPSFRTCGCFLHFSSAACAIS